MQGQTGLPELVQQLTAQIQRQRGRITFADFMEVALYQPDTGYYRRPDSPIGIRGDYFTAVSASPILGRILAGYFQSLEIGPGPIEIVEYGGHRGQLRDDVLAAAPGLAYRIVEAGDSGPGAIEGIVFSNEFLDALPVHRVKAVDGAWQELYVGVKDGQFAWGPGPLSNPRLALALRDLPVAQMEGYETEVNLRAIDWIRDIGRRLRRGYVVTIDYGFERAEYFSPQRPRGTLRCYHKHTLNDEPLARVGEQDITAHVEFTSLIDAGREAGLEPVLFTDLSHFLIKEGEDVLREVTERTAGQVSRERQGLHQLLHPGLMGAAFKVLVQRKG